MNRGELKESMQLSLQSMNDEEDDRNNELSSIIMSSSNEIYQTPVDASPKNSNIIISRSLITSATSMIDENNILLAEESQKSFSKLSALRFGSLLKKLSSRQVRKY